MNLSFFAGALLSYVLTNENGRKMLDKTATLIGESAEKIVNIGIETVKDTLPETSKLLGAIKHETEPVLPESE